MGPLPEGCGEVVNKYRLEPGDIVVARTGATTGYAKLIREKVDAVFASYLVRFKVRDPRALPEFVGLILESSTYKAFVEGVKGGAAQPNANAKSLGRFEFELPPLPVQERVVEVVSAYDELMENNRRRIALLEQAARLLYREWFVHFRFPGHEHVKIIDGVTEGWERVTLEDCLILQRGFDLPLSARNDGNVPVYGSTGIVGYHDVAKVAAPMLITGRSGSLGQVSFVSIPCWPLNTALWVKELRRVSPYFAYFLLITLDLKKYGGGASVPTLDRKVVHKLPVLLPTDQLRASFDEFVAPTFEQIDKLKEQNIQLGNARDLLLPRLMDGRLEL